MHVYMCICDVYAYFFYKTQITFSVLNASIKFIFKEIKLHFGSINFPICHLFTKPI